MPFFIPLCQRIPRFAFIAILIFSLQFSHLVTFDSWWTRKGVYSGTHHMHMHMHAFVYIYLF